MAYTFSVNNIPLTGAVAIYQLITTLTTAGWVRKADSDGTTYNSAGGQVTSGNTGTAGLDNSNAWIRMQAPTVGSNTREFTFQRGASNLGWRIKYSANSHFTGGTAGISQTGSATDEVFMTGGGTDASPTFTTFMSPNNSYRWNIVAGGSSEFYSFVAWGSAIGTSTTATGLLLDVMAASSYPAADIDPAVAYCSVTSTNVFGEIFGSGSFASANLTNPAGARAWLGATTAAGASLTSANVNVSMATYGNGQIGALVTVGTNPFTNKDDLFPAIWGSAFTGFPRGIKGYSTLFKCGTIFRRNMTTCDTVSSNSRDRIYVNGVWLPWSGTKPMI
jgi:hypothetical protein